MSYVYYLADVKRLTQSEYNELCAMISMTKEYDVDLDVTLFGQTRRRPPLTK
jgi:hypothetical protein